MSGDRTLRVNKTLDGLEAVVQAFHHQGYPWCPQPEAIVLQSQLTAWGVSQGLPLWARPQYWALIADTVWQHDLLSALSLSAVVTLPLHIGQMPWGESSQELVLLVSTSFLSGTWAPRLCLSNTSQHFFNCMHILKLSQWEGHYSALAGAGILPSLGPWQQIREAKVIWLRELWTGGVWQQPK